ncbi:unnamed protein product [Closterium sp. Naga37s-1]|nr:unnamed protein product [Closterium sp. Naga37s-1]
MQPAEGIRYIVLLLINANNLCFKAVRAGAAAAALALAAASAPAATGSSSLASAGGVLSSARAALSAAAGSAGGGSSGLASARGVLRSARATLPAAAGSASGGSSSGLASAGRVLRSARAAFAAAASGGGSGLAAARGVLNGAADIDMETIASADAGSPEVPAVEVTSMQFAYPGEPPLISKFNLTLPRGSRCLLIGANGAGKTTLLRVLAGKHMVGGKDVVKVLGRSAFHDTALSCDGSLAYLGGSWSKSVGCAGEVPLQGDFSAEHMIYGVADVDAARRDHLVELLDIDLTWRMHRVSDGQRRRVQICMGLLRPFQVLLLDEVLLLDDVTEDLDVVARMDLLLTYFPPPYMLPSSFPLPLPQVLLLDEVTVDLDVVARMDLLSFFQQECEEVSCDSLAALSGRTEQLWDSTLLVTVAGLLH